MLQIKTNTAKKPRAATKKQPTYVGNHLVVDPRVCHGKMTFRGTRVPVETILYYLATGHTREYLHRSWPEVSAEAIEEAVSLATEAFLQHYGSRRI
jgi:uncharacterized protein (DUF433 family)